MEMTVKWLS